MRQHTNNTYNCTLIFTRYPVAGQVKTRLIPALGADRAALLHRRMTENTVDIARSASACTPTVCFTGARESRFRTWLGDRGMRYMKQPSGNLGSRLTKAFLHALTGGTERVVAIGTDVPSLSSEILDRAFDALDQHDVVLGPAADGGYYLIGMKRLHPALFEQVSWGTEKVLAQTQHAMQHLGLRCSLLPVLPDVDRPVDVQPLRTDPRFIDVFSGPPLLSVIIPTLNEAAALPQTLRRVRTGCNLEIILADGGSSDATAQIAAENGAHFLQTDGGRGAQQNAGAQAANGRHLLFLHADTLPPEGYDKTIRKTLLDLTTVAGAFRLRIKSSSPALRLIEMGANLRSHLLQCPYGDQGLFLEKRVFREAGGFRPLPILEDFDLVRRLRQRGRIATVDTSVTTDARRWKHLGALRTTCINQCMIAGFYMGLSPARLAQFYRKDGS
jgi:hypothetical protein